MAETHRAAADEFVRTFLEQAGRKGGEGVIGLRLRDEATGETPTPAVDLSGYITREENSEAIRRRARQIDNIRQAIIDKAQDDWGQSVEEVNELLNACGLETISTTWRATVTLQVTVDATSEEDAESELYGTSFRGDGSVDIEDTTSVSDLEPV
jgi:hypothetical protein